MWQDIQNYLYSVALKKYAPMAIAAAFTALGTYLAAHAGVLESYGITYGTWPLQWAPADVPSGHVILIELDTLSAAAYTAIVALVAVIMRAAQHHATGTAAEPSKP